ncbi:hypothetical protein ABKN59_005386 [Abortiporus biennis]
MSTNLPFPVSDNRSYVAETARFQDQAFYDDQSDATHYRGPALKLPDYRQYAVPSNRPQVISQPGSPYTALYDPTRLHVPAAYGGGPMHNDHYVHIPQQTMLHGPENAIYASIPRSNQVIASHATPSPTTSHSPPNISHPLPVGNDPSPSPPRYVNRRREKPRIELAPDQPLTTQGKPRTRVYVACVQCRSRKIRCDGAKPVCHNCSRRSSNGGPPECTYDAAPKRRGPDRVPGARQRASIIEETSGLRRKRRRRNAEPNSSVEPTDTTVNALANANPGDGFDLKPVRIAPATAGMASAAQSLIATRPQGLSVVVEDLDVYRSRDQEPPYSADSSHLSPLVPLSHSSEVHHHHTTNENIPNPAQELVRISPTAPYVSYKHPTSELAYAGYSSASFIPSTEEYDYQKEGENKSEIGAEPSLQFARDTWWDALLTLYATKSDPRQLRSNVLTPSIRETSSQQILTDLRFLFRSSNFWFSFFNISRFFTRLLDPTQRNTIQPSLVLSALAVANFIQSSEQENGAKGRAWAMRLRDEAEGALQASLSTRWVDETLVHSSWLIGFFEISAHPNHSTNRVRSAMGMLDSLIRSLSLTQLDKDDPRVSTFTSRLVPTVSSETSDVAHWDPTLQRVPHDHSTHQCTCSSFTLGHNSPIAQEVTPLWLTTPAWKEDWSEADVRKEECRRIVWSSMMLAAGHSLYTSACAGFTQMDLFIADPSNYAVLFPGESLMSTSGGKDTVWALYMRAMLLWHSCIRMRWDATYIDADKAQFAVGAWLEIDRIEASLSKHTCNIERAFLFQGREYLFNARMCISHEFQRYIPQAAANANLLFHRKKAEEWLTHQASVAKQAMFGLQTITGQPNISIGRRSFFVFWFMSQVSRALTLWTCDRSLTVALEMSKTLVGPIEYLMSLWPCPEQQRRFQDLRVSLTNACYAAGMAPPPPPSHPYVNP